MRRLIVNADDFGLTSGVNRAIMEAHEHGVVTSATLMANGAAFEDATRLAASAPRLGVGCHVVLVDGTPVSDASSLSSLLANSKNDRGDFRFRHGISSFAIRTLTGRINPAEVEAEATAQIRKLQAAGVTVSHLDTHKHTHLFPGILRPLLRAARACGIRAVRNPFETVQFASFAGKSKLWIRSVEVFALHRFAGSFRHAVREAGVITPDGTVGMVATGSLDEKLFRSAMEGLPEGTWEFVCHPGYNDAQLERVKTRLRESRYRELQVMTSSGAREVLMRAGIELISYRDLV